MSHLLEGGGMTYAALRERHLEDIRRRIVQHQERLSWSRAQIRAEQDERLRELLAHAKAHSPWHAARLRSTELSELPTMTKRDVMTRWDDIVTDRRLTLDGVTRFLRMESQPAYLFDQFQVFASGGSSGQRGVYVWDWQVLIAAAVANFRYQWRDQSQPPSRTAVLVAGGGGHASMPLFSVTLTESAEARVLPVTLPVQELVAQLNHFQPEQVIGYASVIERLSHEALADRLRIFPERVSTNSEPLTPQARLSIQDAWGVPLNDTWGSTEAGIMGVTCDGSPGLHLTEDLVIIEAEADRTLLTVLSNKTFPFIRYEVEDRLTLLDSRCPCGSLYRMIGDIAGRADAPFVYADGIQIHPVLFRSVLGAEPAILEYQVIQTERGALIEVVSSDPINSEYLIDELEPLLMEAGLRDPVLLIQRVSELRRHEAVGKIRRFQPLSR